MMGVDAKVCFFRQPSEKLSSDVPRAKWRTIILSEIVAPVVLAIIFSVAYLFIKSFSHIDALERLLVIALGPIVLNAAVLVVLFFVSIVSGDELTCKCSD
jgi:1,3-beta-glucan synthase